MTTIIYQPQGHNTKASSTDRSRRFMGAFALTQ